jgi:hypothetical protein
MQRNLWLVSILTLCFVGNQQLPAGQTSGAIPPPSNVTNVRSAFEMCKHQTMFSGIGLGVARRGDDASASLIRALDPKELATPENTKAYLCLVRLAFSKPDSIPEREERIPGVTMFLLEYLKERESDDEALKTEINSMEAYVKQQTQELLKNSQDSLTPGHPAE